MSELIIKNAIEVKTNHGKCCIELCLGDITKLQASEKVDVVLVSALHGMYRPVAGSLLGALKTNLNIDVDVMAKNKGEDLLSMYNCWLSHPLEKHLPFRRLLCFESKIRSGERPQELVGNIFRCLVPVLTNENGGSVITPLLSTGSQRYSEVAMLQSLTETAINWMKAGLPLKLLKIVLFCNIDNGMVKSTHMRKYEELCSKFAEIKGEYIKVSDDLDEEIPVEHDIFLSCSEKDDTIACCIEKELRTIRPDIKLIKEYQSLDTESAWQRELFDTMRKSARVVPILTKNYLQSTSCLEQYHLALCVNRKSRRQMLAPCYVSTVDNMPTYIGLVQYVDCRENDEVKISQYCSELASSLPVSKPESLCAVPIQYDVFVSYCHRDSEQALEIVKLLRDLNPELRIFFDVQELKTGTSWQRTLYHAIDASLCLLAVISKPYLASSVCQEEYNLALAKHCSENVNFRLVPVYIDDDIGTIPDKFTKVEVISAPKATFTDAIIPVCKSVVAGIGKEGLHSNEKSEKKNFINLEQIATRIRKHRFGVKFGKMGALDSDDKVFPPDLSKILTVSDKMDERSKLNSSDAPDIVLSFASGEKKIAQYLARLIRQSAPELKIVDEMEIGRERLAMVEHSSRVVTFLSASYIENPHLVEEFHSALWRQRVNKFPVLFPVKCCPLPLQPTYLHVVSHYVDISDTLWAEVTNKTGFFPPAEGKDWTMQLKSLSRKVALSLYLTAAFLLESIKDQREAEETERPPEPVLLNVMELAEELQTCPV